MESTTEKFLLCISKYVGWITFKMRRTDSFALFCGKYETYLHLSVQFHKENHVLQFRHCCQAVRHLTCYDLSKLIHEQSFYCVEMWKCQSIFHVTTGLYHCELIITPSINNGHVSDNISGRCCILNIQQYNNIIIMSDIISPNLILLVID